MMEEILNQISEAILNGDNKIVPGAVQAALDAGLEPGRILTEAMIPAMEKVGKLFEEGEYFVPEMLISARAMQAGLGVLKPRLVASGVKVTGRVAIGTVKGDLHDIGKNLVAMMLEGAGFEVIDLGTDVTPEKFVECVKAQNVDIVAMSALLTTTMPNMKVTLNALTEAAVRNKVKVMIGGAPVTDAYAAQIGADGYASDASRAVSLARTLVGA
jgi:5-methyltetrahydrofolate--homocysteine methyltransferase